MVAYLLDTNVVSEKMKTRPDAHVLDWLASVKRDDLHLSVLVLGEIRYGADRLRAREPDRADTLDAWITSLTESFGDRIVHVTAEIAEEWGRLNAKRKMPPVDGLMAATAKVNDWVFVTRNTKDVEASGVRVLDPFAAP